MGIKLEVFKAPICPHCPATIELVKDVASKFDEVEIEIIDIEERPEHASKYKIYAVPAIAINGKLKFIGRPSRSELEREIKEAI